MVANTSLSKSSQRSGVLPRPWRLSGFGVCVSLMDFNRHVAYVGEEDSHHAKIKPVSCSFLNVMLSPMDKRRA